MHRVQHQQPYNKKIDQKGGDHVQQIQNYRRVTGKLSNTRSIPLNTKAVGSFDQNIGGNKKSTISSYNTNDSILERILQVPIPREPQSSNKGCNRYETKYRVQVTIRSEEHTS